jgi:hypothetical protein
LNVPYENVFDIQVAQHTDNGLYISLYDMLKEQVELGAGADYVRVINIKQSIY